MFRRLAWLVCFVAWGARAQAQPAPSEPSATSAAQPLARDPQTIAPVPVATPSSSPLGWWWQHSTPVPIVFYTPENQLGGGGGVMTTWVLPEAIENRPSNVLVYGIYTMRKQTIFGASYELRFARDRHVLTQELRYIDWPDRFYGVGNHTHEQNRQDYTDHYWQLESEYQARVFRKLYVGVRHQFRVSQTQDLDPDTALAKTRPLGVGRVLWSGAGPLVLWDSRNGLFWPEGGSYLRADAAFYRKELGADFSAQIARLDLRHYQPLWSGHVLALRFVSYAASGALPFQLLPALGGSNLFRGWYLGRLRDRVLSALEAEYRIALAKRWAVVGFGSLGRVARRLSSLSPTDLHAAGGAGLRFAVRPETRANFRLDVAYGDELYLYFQFREAF